MRPPIAEPITTGEKSAVMVMMVVLRELHAGLRRLCACRIVGLQRLDRVGHPLEQLGIGIGR